MVCMYVCVCVSVSLPVRVRVRVRVCMLREDVVAMMIAALIAAIVQT